MGCAFTDLEIMKFCRVSSNWSKWIANVRLCLYEGELQTSAHSRWHFPATTENNTSPRRQKRHAASMEATDWLNSLFAFNFICPINHHLIADVVQPGCGQACPLQEHINFISIVSLFQASPAFIWCLFPFSPGSSSKVAPLFLSADGLVWYSIL